MLTYLIPIVFAASLVSAASYWLVSRGRQEFYGTARMCYHLATIGVMVSAAILMYLLQTDQFQYTYVWEYSSRELSPIFKYSAFYAGQEGSFLLWTLYISIIGIVLMQYAARQKYEISVMRIYVLVQAFLLLLIVVKNPFLRGWEAHPGEIPVGFMPNDGHGLNPLLQNYWIAIHPPLLFLGFASMTVPFVFAVAGLHKRDYQGWITTAMPWVLFGAMVLGFGIMLGGFWAYETLGWGGFWGWDPVENSSLIPWLGCVALVHTMLTQKRTKGLIKTNFVLAISVFLLVLYSTFLTRSGVLGEASVHSFETPGMFAYILLLAFIAIFGAIGIIPLIRRAKELIPLGKEYKIYSRETALGIGSAVLAACAVIVLLGTSWPIFAKAAMDVSYYNNLNLPIAIIIGLLNGIAILLKWRTTAPKELFRHAMFALVASFVATVFIVWMGLHDIRFILLTFAAFFALFVNAQIGYRIVRGNPRFVGAYISHFGISLLFLGIVATAHYSEKTTVDITDGQSVSALGYKFTFLGKEQVELDKPDREKYQYNIQVTRGDENFILHPIIFWSDYNKRSSAIINPGIRNLVVKDVYIAPQGLNQDGGTPEFELTKGAEAHDTLSGFTVKFLDYDVNSQMLARMQQGENVKIGAKALVTNPSGRSDTMEVYFSPRSMNSNEMPHAAIPESHATFYLVRPEPNMQNPDESKAVLAVDDPDHPAPPARDVITLDVSIKPFINLVWGGVIIMVLGFLFSIIRRKKETDRELLARA